MTFRKIFENMNKQEKTEIHSKEEIEVIDDRPLVEIEENPLKLIRTFGYKIKLETPTKKGKMLQFFKGVDALEAYSLINDVYKKYNISLNGNKLTIELK